MTADLEGSVEERPIDLVPAGRAAAAPSAADTPAPAPAPAAAPAPAPASASAPPRPKDAAPAAAATSANSLSSDEDSANSDDEEGGEDEDEAMEEAEEDPEAAEPAAKKQQVQPSLLAFVSKHAPPAARVASERKMSLSTYKPKEKAPKARNTQGRGASSKKNGGRKNDVRPATLQKR
eukprot:3355312-Prymnesium_polylepis.1